MWIRCGEALLLAAGYVLAGRVALLLAIPPGYAMAVYPPAGIALGVILARGYALAPGVAIGSFVLNLWIGWQAHGALTIMDGVAPAVVGIGATLQAVVGAWLVRRFIGYPTSLDKEWDILMFLALGGPVASLVNASIGVGVLFLTGGINQASFLGNWATWWIGDTLGVLVLTPLLLIALGEPRSIWWSRRFSVGIPLMVSMAVIIAAFVSARNLESEQQRKEFREEAARMVHMLETRLDVQTEIIESLEGLFASSGEVTRQDFHTFASSALARHPTVQALEWAPRVIRGDRERFESVARKQTNTAFGINERTAKGIMGRAGERNEYFPVFYVEPMAGNAPVFGYDVGSTADRKRAIEAARDTGVTVASAPISLIQDGPESARTGGLLFSAVYARGAPVGSVDQRRRAFRGVVLSVIRIDNLIRMIFSDDQRNQIRIQVFDIAAPSTNAILYDTLLRQRDDSSWSTKFKFGGREYAFVGQPSSAYWERHRSWGAWWMLIGGSMFTSLLGTYLLIMSAQAYRVEKLVRLRTRELHESRDRLKQNATLLQTVMDSMSSCVYVRDVEGRLQYVNKEFERVFQNEARAAIGKAIDDSFHSHLAERFRDDERSAIRDRKSAQSEVVVSQDDGPHTYLLVCSPRFSDEGAVSGICGVATDITQNKKTEEDMVRLNGQLEKTTSLQKAILNSANFSIISTDIHGTIQVFNVGAQNLLGYSSEEMVGVRTPEILHDGEEIKARAASLTQETGRPIEPGFEVFVTRARYGVPDEREWTYIRKDGTRFPAMLSVTGLWNEARELTGFLGVAYDMTERKKVENMKNEFISTVSHELRTPLTSIHGALDLLIAGTVGDIQPEIRSLLDIANEDCDRLIRLVSDILDMEKMESGSMRFELTVQPLLPLIEQAIIVTQPFAAQYGVYIALHADTDEMLAAVDADRIIQVLVNLLSNAAKYSKPHSVVEVRLARNAEHVRTSVIDQGDGIAEAFRQRIFQKFAQADSSDSRQKGGTGLGLSICKAIIERHHGHIDFHSTPNVGSEFYFELSLANGCQVAAA